MTESYVLRELAGQGIPTGGATQDTRTARQPGSNGPTSHAGSVSENLFCTETLHSFRVGE